MVYSRGYTPGTPSSPKKVQATYVRTQRGYYLYTWTFWLKETNLSEEPRKPGDILLHIHMHMYMYMHIMHIHIHVYMYMYIYIYVSLLVDVYLHVYSIIYVFFI